MRILSFDPGGTTGYVIVADGQLKEAGHLATLSDLVYVCFSVEADQIVFEGFARGNSAVDDQLETIELCGAIRACADILRLPCRKQFPAVRTGYVPLAKAWLTSQHKEQDVHHAIDALAHAMYFMDKEGIAWPKQYWMSRVFQ